MLFFFDYIFLLRDRELFHSMRLGQILCQIHYVWPVRAQYVSAKSSPMLQFVYSISFTWLWVLVLTAHSSLAANSASTHPSFKNSPTSPGFEPTIRVSPSEIANVSYLYAIYSRLFQKPRSIKTIQNGRARMIHLFVFFSESFFTTYTVFKSYLRSRLWLLSHFLWKSSIWMQILARGTHTV